MIAKKFNIFVLCTGILISSVCQSVSGAQSDLGNKSDYIVAGENQFENKNYYTVKTENQKDNGFPRKIVNFGKKIENKLKDVKDSIPKEVYVAISTAFGIKLMYEILKDGINYYYFNEENKTFGDAIEPKNSYKKSIDTVQTNEKNKAKSNNSIVTPNNQNIESSNGVEATDKITKDNSGGGSKDLVPKTIGNVPNSSENLETTQEVSGENSSSNPEGLTTKTNGEELAPSSEYGVDAIVETDNLKEDLMPVFLGDYSDPLLYLLISLTPKEWGLQEVWYSLWHYNLEKDPLNKKILQLLVCLMLIFKIGGKFYVFYEYFCDIINVVTSNSQNKNGSNRVELTQKISAHSSNDVNTKFNKDNKSKFTTEEFIYHLAFGILPLVDSIAGATVGWSQKVEEKKLKWRVLRALRGFLFGYTMENVVFVDFTN